VEGLPRMTNELNRGTPAPVRLSIPSNRAAQGGDNKIDRRREPKVRIHVPPAVSLQTIGS
jgi:hypothetical protein